MSLSRPPDAFQYTYRNQTNPAKNDDGGFDFGLAIQIALYMSILFGLAIILIVAIVINESGFTIDGGVQWLLTTIWQPIETWVVGIYTDVTTFVDNIYNFFYGIWTWILDTVNLIFTNIDEVFSRINNFFSDI